MIKETENGLVLTLKVIPNSSKNELVVEENFLKAKVTAQALENKANKALIAFLSNTFKIPKSNIEILKGETSREKTILLANLSKDKKSDVILQLTK